MTIVYKGMRRMTTDVLADYGQAHYLQNVRLKRVGEMGRRAGLGKSTMAQQSGPVQFMIGGWSNVPFMVNGTTGEVFGQEDPLAYWTAATMRIPDGVVGQPVAPVINSITPTPADPGSVGQGNTSFLANITYDGLSGPLIYSWGNLNQLGMPFTVISPIDGTVNPAVYDFTGGNPADFYSGTLTVTTTIGGLSDNHSVIYTVV